MTISGPSAPRLGPDQVALLGPSVQLDSPGEDGYRRLIAGAAEAHAVRNDLGGCVPSGRWRGLVAFAQVSDLHVTDAQSPGRAEYLDRLGDPDSEVATLVGPVGTYRAQESLTHHVVEAMTASLRRIDRGPITGSPVSFAVSTGDAADNAQANEIDASIRLLDGGCDVVPDAGDRSTWEGVGTAANYDVHYWHPDGTPPGERTDHPRGRFGFPTVPGLLDAARQPFHAGGLGLPWHPVYGNHDCLLAGTLPATPALRQLARGGRKGTGWPPGLDAPSLLRLLGETQHCPPDLLRPLLTGPWREVARDTARGHLTTRGWAEAHAGRSARPSADASWYAFDAGRMRGLVLDTVNAEGGWQGSIHGAQLAWLEEELLAGSSSWVDRDGHVCHSGREDRLFVLFSHHPLRSLSNPWSPAGEHRATTPEVEALLSRFPNLVLWVNGHTHANTITAHRSDPAVGGGWWEVTTASHIDWPQQSRIIELGEDLESGDLVIGCTVVDHAGPVDPRPGHLHDPLTLASWSRELAANDWQRSGELDIGTGAAGDRNVLLVTPLSVPATVG